MKKKLLLAIFITNILFANDIMFSVGTFNIKENADIVYEKLKYLNVPLNIKTLHNGMHSLRTNCYSIFEEQKEIEEIFKTNKVDYYPMQCKNYKKEIIKEPKEEKEEKTITKIKQNNEEEKKEIQNNIQYVEDNKDNNEEYLDKVIKAFENHKNTIKTNNIPQIIITNKISKKNENQESNKIVIEILDKFEKNEINDSFSLFKDLVEKYRLNENLKNYMSFLYGKNGEKQFIELFEHKHLNEQNYFYFMYGLIKSGEFEDILLEYLNTYKKDPILVSLIAQEMFYKGEDKKAIDIITKGYEEFNNNPYIVTTYIEILKFNNLINKKDEKEIITKLRNMVINKDVIKWIEENY